MKSHLLAKQAGEDRSRHGRRRETPAAPTTTIQPRERDVPGHDGLHSRLDNGGKDAAIAGPPSLLIKRVDGQAEVLVAEVNSIAWEMLSRRAQPVVLKSTDQRAQQRNAIVETIPQTACAQHRIQPVQREVGNRTKCPIKASLAGLSGRPVSVFISQFRRGGSPQGHQLRKFCQAADRPAGSIFQIPGNRKRDRAGLLKIVNDLPHRIGIGLSPADDLFPRKDAADRVALQIASEIAGCLG